MKNIPLTKGLEATVDDSDFEWLSQWSWFTCNGYACRHGDGEDHKKFIYMHRQILDAQPGLEVDQANGNKLDNRRSNIRCCTARENQINRPIRSNNKSGFKGVSPYKGRWEAQIRINGKRTRLGRFPTPELAYQSYCEASKIYHGEFSRL